jgi:hypothetical protein
MRRPLPSLARLPRTTTTWLELTPDVFGPAADRADGLVTALGVLPGEDEL